jgi:DNA-binding NarL/FixJ family response regulator
LPGHGLTAREIEVLQLLATGLRVREIAEQLSLSPRTVEKNVASARLRVGARSTPQLMAIVVRDGIVLGP